MIEEEKTFIEIVNTIANEKHSFGNKLLYDMCDPKTGQEWDRPEILADKIWLIGRAYAASPERRYTTGKSSKVGDGTGDYFKSIAKYILNHVKQESKSKDILKNNKFRFDFSNNDIAILLTGINCVLEFNSLVKRASQNYDEGFIEDSNYKNQISFCSKFLHFHFPNTVFIIDSFSRIGASYLFSEGTRTNAVVKHSIGDVKISNTAKVESKGATNMLVNYEAYIANYESFEKEFVKKLEELKLDSHGIKYAEHCIRAYKTACLFKKFLGNELSSCSYPRIVDTLFLKIKAEK